MKYIGPALGGALGAGVMAGHNGRYERALRADVMAITAGISKEVKLTLLARALLKRRKSNRTISST